ncbi:EAL domain-containing protein [Fredinandcohnia sp. 179-A 10B2 NHS]|uniref:EAL domain-containing protein n=1 Tax=Fredinandcohnia sp. 179-A 10B2 NHS TaxID=3235176 RepID=UPI0039A06D23
MKRFNNIILKDKQYSHNDEQIEAIIFEIILKHIKDLIYVMKVEENCSFSYVFINEEAKGHAKLQSDCIGKTLHEVLPIDTANHLDKQYASVLEKKEAISFQDVVTLADNRIVYGESILTPIFDDHGEVRFIVSVTRDISESVAEKNLLYESRQRYKSLIDHNMDGVISVDSNGNILGANNSTLLVTGYTESEMQGKTIFTFVIEEDKETFQQIYNETLSGKPMEFIGCHIRHKSGKILKVHVKTIPILINRDRSSGAYVIIKDITEQTNYEEMITYMAYHDQLTGLANRSSLKKELEDSVEQAKKNKEKLALMYVDLDRFKFLNDSMGHVAGDMLLKEVGKRLEGIRKNGYKVFRQGGDEFIVLLTNTSREATVKCAENIIKTIEKPFLMDGKNEYYITASVGISLYPSDGQDGDTLIKNADTALYRAKDLGRSLFQFYSSEMQKQTSHLMVLETGLRKAIEKDELELYYQPQFDLVSNEVTSFEALLRWKHPTLGFVSPAEFIPIAEETGLILSIGEWVIQTVCQKIKSWKTRGFDSFSIGVNLSAKQFQQEGLVEMIESNIKSNQIDPRFLEFELTEGALQDAKKTLLTLNKLKDVGVRISVDDFGTGYSSLSYIKRFPIDTLKIDQSFVREVLTDEKDAAITTTIIHLAQSLGLSVIAEGVEDEKQVEFFKIMGCHKAQGYYFSKPLPENEMIEHYFIK